MTAVPADRAKPPHRALDSPKSNFLRVIQQVSGRGGSQMQVGLDPESTLVITKFCCLPLQSPRLCILLLHTGKPRRRSNPDPQ